MESIRNLSEVAAFKREITLASSFLPSSVNANPKRRRQAKLASDKSTGAD